MTSKLNNNERETDLASVLESGWEMVPGRDAIMRDFIFKNFNQAFGWMTQVAMIAEKMDHHPEWSNVYNRVSVVLSTHSVEGLSQLDIALAKKMNKLAG